jgi:hypothetical protein
MFINMLVNVIIFVPKTLIEYRYDGAIMGILLSIPIGLLLSFLYSKAFSKFPGQGLPDLLADSKHHRLKLLHLASIQVLWFSAGLITLLGFIDILSRFINPEAPKLVILSIYLAAICLIIQLPTKKVMDFLEIVLVLNAPLITFIIFKMFTSNYLNWDSILEVGTHIFEWPNLQTTAAATYVFSGYTNIIIFNRLFKEKVKSRNFIVVLVLGLFNLFTTFFIPIGFHGADGTQEYLYPWITTADSLRLVFSPIERVIFLFLMLYMSISLMSVVVHWHVALELIKGTFKDAKNKKKNRMVVILFVVMSVAGVLFINSTLLIKLTVFWFIFRFGSEIIVVVLTFLWSRRRTA